MAILNYILSEGPLSAEDERRMASPRGLLDVDVPLYPPAGIEHVLDQIPLSRGGGTLPTVEEDAAAKDAGFSPSDEFLGPARGPAGTERMLLVPGAETEAGTSTEKLHTRYIYATALNQSLEETKAATGKRIVYATDTWIRYLVQHGGMATSLTATTRKERERARRAALRQQRKRRTELEAQRASRTKEGGNKGTRQVVETPGGSAAGGPADELLVTALEEEEEEEESSTSEEQESRGRGFCMRLLCCDYCKWKKAIPSEGEHPASVAVNKGDIGGKEVVEDKPSSRRASNSSLQDDAEVLVGEPQIAAVSPPPVVAISVGAEESAVSSAQQQDQSAMPGAPTSPGEPDPASSTSTQRDPSDSFDAATASATASAISGTERTLDLDLLNLRKDGLTEAEGAAVVAAEHADHEEVSCVGSCFSWCWPCRWLFAREDDHRPAPSKGGAVLEPEKTIDEVLNEEDEAANRRFRRNRGIRKCVKRTIVFSISVALFAGFLFWSLQPANRQDVGVESSYYSITCPAQFPIVPHAFIRPGDPRGIAGGGHPRTTTLSSEVDEELDPRNNPFYSVYAFPQLIVESPPAAKDGTSAPPEDAAAAASARTAAAAGSGSAALARYSHTICSSTVLDCGVGYRGHPAVTCEADLVYRVKNSCVRVGCGAPPHISAATPIYKVDYANNEHKLTNGYASLRDGYVVRINMLRGDGTRYDKVAC